MHPIRRCVRVIAVLLIVDCSVLACGSQWTGVVTDETVTGLDDSALTVLTVYKREVRAPPRVVSQTSSVGLSDTTRMRGREPGRRHACDCEC